LAPTVCNLIHSKKPRYKLKNYLGITSTPSLEAPLAIAT